MSAVASSRVDSILSHLTPHFTASASSSSSSSSEPVTITSRANGVALITINNPPVNSLHPRVQAGIGACYEEAVKDPSIKAVVITGTGGFFMAGADIEYVHNNLQNKKGVTKADIVDYIKTGNDIFSRLESGPKPTVAAVNGTALGGGCELAMACNSRLAVANSTFGQPELNLGIIPGLGGTQRFPRLIGLKAAVPATLSGKSFKAAEALKLGLIDAVVKPDQLIAAASKLALDIASGKVPKRRALYEEKKIGSIEDGVQIIEGARAQAKKKSKNVPHPFVYLDCVTVGLKQGGEAGIKAEINGIAELILSPTSKALIHFFFASRATSKVSGVPAKATGKPIKRVGVLGGGTMGAGICIVYLFKGYEVVLKEINEKQLLLGVERIIDQLTRVIKSRKLPMNAIEQIMRGFSGQTDYKGFDKLDLVIEAVLENLPLKQKIFAELEEIVPKHAILATNTSTIDIEQIGAKTKSSDRIIGLHFFSPAHVMPLLEIIRTKHTSPNAVAQSLQMSKAIGKTPVVSGNCVGFIANRVFFPYGQSASFLVDAGIDPYRVDKALQAWGMPMGVFRMSDLSGVDIFIHVSGMINSAYGDRCYNTTMGKKLFDKNRLGQKTGAGYYKYVKGQPQPDPAALAPLLAAARADAGKLPSVADLTDKDLVEVVMFPVVNECLRVVAEGFAQSMSDVDVVSVMGYGVPAWRGGMLHWAEHQAGGWKYVRDRLTHFSQSYGSVNPVLKSFFKPSELLEQLASK